MARESGGMGNPNHAKPHKCCTTIAPQVVLHLQLLRHKILAHLALQAKYRHRGYFMVGECGRFFFTSCERRERTSERSERVSSATPRNE